MSLLTDLRAVSGNALEHLAARMSDLPAPVLVALGAGDLARTGLADLRDAVADSLGNRVKPPGVVTDIRTTVAGFPAKAQKAATDAASSISSIAAGAPARAQGLLAQVPDRLAGVPKAAQSVSPTAVRETVDAYTNLVGIVYGSLVERGERTWTRIRGAGFGVEAVVDPAEDQDGTAASDAAASAAVSASAAKAAAAASAAAASRAAAAARAAAAVRAATQAPGPHGEPVTGEHADPEESAPKVGDATAANKRTDLPDLRAAAPKFPAAEEATAPEQPTDPPTVTPEDVVPKGAVVSPLAASGARKPPARRGRPKAAGGAPSTGQRAEPTEQPAKPTEQPAKPTE